MYKVNAIAIYHAQDSTGRLNFEVYSKRYGYQLGKIVPLLGTLESIFKPATLPMYGFFLDEIQEISLAMLDFNKAYERDENAKAERQANKDRYRRIV